MSLLICTDGERGALELFQGLRSQKIPCYWNQAQRMPAADGDWSGWFEIWVPPEHVDAARQYRDQLA